LDSTPHYTNKKNNFLAPICIVNSTHTSEMVEEAILPQLYSLQIRRGKIHKYT
jgi:hypothetical protein